MDPSQMAGGVSMPPPQALQGGQPSQPPQGTIAPGQAQVGGDITKVLEIHSQAIQQTVDPQGYVDMQRLIQMWPQLAQQMGINIPFQTVLQLIQQNPDMVSDIIVKHGLAGITLNGRKISAEQLAGMGSGASGAGGM